MPRPACKYGVVESPTAIVRAFMRINDSIGTYTVDQVGNEFGVVIID